MGGMWYRIGQERGEGQKGIAIFHHQMLAAL
jgi:hypothetical protein